MKRTSAVRLGSLFVVVFLVALTMITRREEAHEEVLLKQEQLKTENTIKGLQVDEQVEDKTNNTQHHMNEEKIDKIVSGMTLEEKVGQMLLARCPEIDAKEAIATYHLGGFVLFKRDFEGLTQQEVKSTLEGYQAVSKFPLTIAVDEEGGSVVRISSNPSLADKRFISPQALYAEGGLEAIAQDAVKKAQLLGELGVTMNLAPVADISQSPKDYIYDRTLGKGAEETAAYVETVVAATQQNGISATLKHFPGYGGNVDTHVGVAVDQRSLEHFQEQEWLPFKKGIEAGVDAILVSHNIVEAIDAQYPASLSKKMHQVLREDLGFQGIIMTDDLEMDAIKKFTHHTSPVVEAVNAGNDLIIITDYQQGFEAVIQAVELGVVEEEILNQAVKRILSWKLKDSATFNNF